MWGDSALSTLQGIKHPGFAVSKSKEAKRFSPLFLVLVSLLLPRPPPPPDWGHRKRALVPLLGVFFSSFPSPGLRTIVLLSNIHCVLSLLSGGMLDHKISY